MSTYYRSMNREDSVYVQEQLNILRSEGATDLEKEDAKNCLADRLMPIVETSVAVNYRLCRWDEREEIVQYTMEYLMYAIDRYDETRSDNFLAYFVSTYVQKGYEQFTISAPLVSIPEKKLRDLKKLRREQTRVQEEDGECSDEAVVSRLGWDKDKAKELVDINRQFGNMTRLDTPVSNENGGKPGTLADLVVSDQHAGVERTVIDQETARLAKEMLLRAVYKEKARDEIEEQVNMFFMVRLEGYTAAEVAEIYGISEQKVKAVVTSIRKRMASYYGDALYRMLGGRKFHCPGYKSEKKV